MIPGLTTEDCERIMNVIHVQLPICAYELAYDLADDRPAQWWFGMVEALADADVITINAVSGHPYVMGAKPCAGCGWLPASTVYTHRDWADIDPKSPAHHYMTGLD